MKCVGRKLQAVTVNGQRIYPKIMRDGNQEFEFDGFVFKEIVPCSQGTNYFTRKEPPADDEVIVGDGVYMDKNGNTRKAGVLSVTFVAQVKGCLSAMKSLL